MKVLRIASLLIAATLTSGIAAAQNASAASANASISMSQLTASVVAGTASVLATAASLTVVAVEQAGESMVLMLKDVSTGATVSIKASARTAGNASLAAGTVLLVTASAAGYSIYLAGRLIAFIPNEIGKSLVYHSRVTK